MKRKKVMMLSLVAVVVIALVAIPIAAGLNGAQVLGSRSPGAPGLINYQGRLTDSGGNPLPDGSYQVEFRLYDAATGDTLLWSETQTVSVAGGLFNVLLGSVTGLSEFYFDGETYLEVVVEGEIMTPRQQLVSVPYAFQAQNAQNAETLGGQFPYNFALMGHEHDFAYVNLIGDMMTGTLNLPPNGLVAGTDQLVLTGDRVGIGTTSPNDKLDVAGHISSSESYKLDGDTVLSNTGTHNILVGKDAGASIDTGSYNSAVGYSALYSNTAGGYNSAMGYNALFSNTLGLYNSAMGYYALYYNTASFNSAMGHFALRSNTTGNSNSAMGSYALRNNTTGLYNSAMGYAALRNNTTGLYNSAMGSYAGYNNTTGSNNVFLGYRAGYNENGSNKLYIANSDADPPLIYGEFDTGNVGIGTTSPTEKLEVDGHTIAAPIAGKWQCTSYDAGAGYWQWNSQLMNTEPGILEWTAGADNITIAKAGYYLVSTGVMKSALSSGEQTSVYIRKNDFWIAVSYTYAAGTYHHHDLSVVEFFNAGDVVKVENPDSDSDRYGGGPPYSILSIYRLN